MDELQPSALSLMLSSPKAKELDERLSEGRRQEAIYNILKREGINSAPYQQRLINDLIISDRNLSPTEKQKAYFEANSPSMLGKAILAGLAAIAAPYILNKILPEGGTSTALSFLSIPLAAYGGASLYDMLPGGGGQNSNFSSALPMSPMVDKYKYR